MSLEYVNPGQNIRSSTINSIIDSLGGPEIPSDGNFINTPKGSLFRRSYSTGNGITNKLYEFLDVKQAEAPAEMSCAYKTIYLNLGRDLDFAKNKLDSDAILCYDGDSEEGFEISASNFHINGETDDGANFYDGYVCTKLSAVQKFKASDDEDAETIGYGDGTLYGWKFETKKDNNDATVFVVTNENDEDTVKGFLENQGYSEPKFRQKRKLAVSTDSVEGNVLIKIPEDVELEPEDIRFKLRGTIEKNDNGEKRFKVEYYLGYFLADDKDADTGVRWNNHQFNDITPDPALGWHTLSVSNWMSEISEKIPVYLNLTATYEPATGSGEDFNGQFEVSLKAAEEGRSIPHHNEEDVEEEGTNSISSTYVIGQIDFEGESVKVKQNIIGEQTNIELFNEEAIEGALADLSSEYFSVDSALSVLQLSSIERHTYKDEDGTVLGNALEIYLFHDIENGRDIEEEDEDYTDIIVRRQSENGLPAEVQYMKFSSVLDEISNVCSVYVDQRLSGITGLSGDSQISVLQLSSIVVDTITHKIIDESGQEKVVSADAISMFKFNEPEGLGDKKHPWELPTHDFVLRKHDGSNMYLEYWPLSNMLSIGGGTEISVDTEIEDQTSSLQKLSTDEGEWYQLYNFDKSSTDLTVTSDLNGPGRWYAPAPTGLTDTSALFLIKDTQTKQLKYAQLSVTPPAVDNHSIQRFWGPDFPGQPQMLTLNRFWEHPLDGTLTGVLSSNKLVVDFNGTDGTFLMQGYRNGQLNLKYMHLQLSVDLSASGSEISVDSEVESRQLSSLGVISTDNGEKIYELYNFDKMNTDVNSRIMTIGGLDADRVGKVGKLIDANSNVLSAIDIVVRDKDTHEIKYMNLSVDETYVDSYIGGAGGTNSIIYTTNFAGLCYLKLYNFENYNANDYLVCNLSSNGKAVFGKDGGQDATYVLCKNYNTNTNRWTLEYKKLQIDCNLSGGGEVSSISGDTNVITTRKSIDTKTESGKTFHQLHNFDNPAPTTKTVDMLAKNTAYDTLDSNEYFVIKSGNEVKYKKVQIKDNTPGGGSTTGYSGEIYGDPRLKYNTNGYYQIELWAKKMTYANGLLTNVGNEELVSTLPTTPLTLEIL